MAAKKITKWHVTFELDHDPGDDIVTELVGADYIIETLDSFVCSHCGKPWPLLRWVGEGPGDDPLSEDYYQFHVRRGTSCLAYCCDATRLECESARVRPTTRERSDGG